MLQVQRGEALVAPEGRLRRLRQGLLTLRRLWGWALRPRRLQARFRPHRGWSVRRVQHHRVLCLRQAPARSRGPPARAARRRPAAAAAGGPSHPGRAPRLRRLRPGLWPGARAPALPALRASLRALPCRLGVGGAGGGEQRDRWGSGCQLHRLRPRLRPRAACRGAVARPLRVRSLPPALQEVPWPPRVPRVHAGLRAGRPWRLCGLRCRVPELHPLGPRAVRRRRLSPRLRLQPRIVPAVRAGALHRLQLHARGGALCGARAGDLQPLRGGLRPHGGRCLRRLRRVLPPL
mmetsp:Transcript_71362/g.212860  ORF Transcript_71362/g.212860 Transcript_71362/m.212860 type:complete len:291 (-) Transcript_71362:292-1164(-)